MLLYKSPNSILILAVVKYVNMNCKDFSSISNVDSGAVRSTAPDVLGAIPFFRGLAHEQVFAMAGAAAWPSNGFQLIQMRGFDA